MSGLEPGLSSEHAQPTSGFEPMLGGSRRYRLARETLFALLNLHDTRQREMAVSRVLAEGAEQLYGNGLMAVLRPDARHYRPGRIWKIPFSYEEKLAAIDSLLKLTPERALSGCIIAVGNDDAELQRAAIWLMSDIPGDEAERALLTILEDPRTAIRHPTIRALARRWNQSEATRLVHPHGTVVTQAATWLGQFGDLRTQHLLIAALPDRTSGTTDEQQATAALITAIARIARRGTIDDVQRAARVCRGIMQRPRWGSAIHDLASTTLVQLVE